MYQSSTPTLGYARRRVIASLAATALLSVAAVSIGIGVDQAKAAGQTFVVNSLGDNPDYNPGDGACNTMPSGLPECTLRAAIMEANAQTGADTINFGVAGPITMGPALYDYSNPTPTLMVRGFIST